MMLLALISLITMGNSGIMAFGILFAVDPPLSFYPGMFVSILFWPMVAGLILRWNQRFKTPVAILQGLLLLGNLVFWILWILENHGL